MAEMMASLRQINAYLLANPLFWLAFLGLGLALVLLAWRLRLPRRTFQATGFIRSTASRVKTSRLPT